MNRNTRRAAWLGALLGMIVAVTPAFATDYNEKFEKTYPVGANVRVSLKNINGGVEILGWDRNEVKVVATKHADSQQKLARMNIDVQAGRDAVAIETKLPTGTNNNPGSVEYEIQVPRTARLDTVETVNGRVQISEIRGSVRASSVNGGVSGTDLTGNVDLSTVNGGVKFDSMEVGGAGNVKLSTVNGGVECHLPADSNVHLTASTVHGGIHSDFGDPKRSAWVGANLDTTLGTGTTKLELSSVNGGITIRKGSKGL